MVIITVLIPTLPSQQAFEVGKAKRSEWSHGHLVSSMAQWDLNVDLSSPSPTLEPQDPTACSTRRLHI